MTSNREKQRIIQETYSPIDNSIYVKREQANSDDINQVLQKAVTAQADWRHILLQERAEICHKMVDAFVANENEIANELCWMMGRPIQYARGEVAGLAERARYMIDVAETALAPIQLPEKTGFQRYIKREALGTTFVIAPWNYPYLTSINAIMPAIMAGNSLILKHSTQTPLCAEQLYKAFQQAGLPDGVFQYLHLSHENTETVIKNSRVDYVAFTGSVAGGAMVEKAVNGRFIGVGLELGGKDPAYVRADADIDDAVATCIDGAFFNSGQSCCGIERIYVDSRVFDEFVRKSVDLVNGYQLGLPDDPNTTLGPMVKASAADFVRLQVQDAISQGAITHINADDFPMNEVGTPYLAPQLLTNVNHQMRVMTEESFGPVVGIMKVESDEEAITLMNDSEFGLTAAVFTKDVDAAVAIGEQLETGTFFVNRCDYLDPALAWTGVKHSGRGCTLSVLGYESLTRPKSFHIKL
ncbi:aldehyde dehydrogenase family protein [Moritella sp. F3]|uniref:aldehyde dehydrogenase family protein n=1 Tax=Moritella sp. F3 TaxID=2718882 RepID=UPI0018E1B59C|nr:aldehyde dehydrogenase family protein [Moritella sp. F3]GIC76910.1 aldehyde dehydrogenase [Moritella sp. F1]GIC80093.1 aldehyde dehydrogenase [Moritella sp. F3]